MYCEECGAKIRPGIFFCTSCGTRLSYAHPYLRPAYAAPNVRDFSTSNNLLQRPVLVSIFALLYIVAALFMMAGSMGKIQTDAGVVVLLLGVVSILTGMGLWNLKNYGRLLHMFISGLSVITLIGAPIAVLVFWYFTRPAIRILFSGKRHYELSPIEVQALTGYARDTAPTVFIASVLTLIVVAGGLLAVLVI